MNTDPIEVGQVWASTDPRDVASGERQHRVVTYVDPDRAYLHTPGSRYDGSFGVRIINGRIDRHRRVA